MPFDWFIIITLCISFIVVLWLLKRFLYQPIIDDLDVREQCLQQLLCVANNKINKAKALQQSCENEYQDFEQQRELLLEKSQEEAATVGKKLIQSAHEAADDMLRKRLGAIQHELQSLQQKILNQNITEVYAIAEKMLTDLMGVELHEAMLSRFTDRLKTLSEEQCDDLIIALKRSNNHAVIRSAHALSEQNKLQISRSLSTHLDNKHPIELKLSFILVPDLVSGLELSASGWKLSWSINQHLHTLQENVRYALQLMPLKITTKPYQTAEKHSVSKQSEPLEH